MSTPRLILLLFLFLFAGGVSAQPGPDTADPPDLTVAKKSWRKVVRHPALDADPFEANDAQKELQQAQKDNAVRNAIRIREGVTPQPTVARRKPLGTEPEGPSARYVYSVKVRNTGTKTILALVWDYRFFDPLTLEEVGQRSFTHKVKIRPGKDYELIGQSASPPTRVTDATKPTKGLGSQYTEKIVVRRVEYDDGSVWVRPMN